VKKFTEEQIAMANNTNLLGLSRQLGYNAEEGHKGNYHIKDHGGLYINDKKNSFYCWASESGGGPIQFLMFTQKMNWVDAMKYLVGDGEIQQQRTDMNWKKPQEQKLTEFKLPAKSETSYKRLFAYLTKTRGIDKDIVIDLVNKKKIYESSPHHNVVFVGYDESGQPRQAFQRGTVTGITFKGEVAGGDKNYCFAMEGKSDKLIVCEAAIDAMSDATFYKINDCEWRNEHRIALGGLSDKALEKYLTLHPEIKRIKFEFDNDKDARYSDGRPAPNWGQQAAVQLADKYSKKGYSTEIETPSAKDVNEDLLFILGVRENSRNMDIADHSNEDELDQAL
jgi:hypothetical protein